MNHFEHFWKFLLRYQYRVFDTLDEYSLSKINAFGNGAFMILNVSFLIAILLNLATGIKDWLLIPFAVQIILYLIREKFINSLGINRLDVLNEDYQKAKRFMIKRCLLFALRNMMIFSLVALYLVSTKSIHYHHRSYGSMLFYASVFNLFVCLLLFKNDLKKHLACINIVNEDNDYC